MSPCGSRDCGTLGTMFEKLECSSYEPSASLLRKFGISSMFVMTMYRGYRGYSGKPSRLSMTEANYC